MGIFVTGASGFIGGRATRRLLEFMHALASTAGVDLETRSLPGGVVRILAAALEDTWTTPPTTASP